MELSLNLNGTKFKLVEADKESYSVCEGCYYNDSNKSCPKINLKNWNDYLCEALATGIFQFKKDEEDIQK